MLRGEIRLHPHQLPQSQPGCLRLQPQCLTHEWCAEDPSGSLLPNVPQSGTLCSDRHWDKHHGPGFEGISKPNVPAKLVHTTDLVGADIASGKG